MSLNINIGKALPEDWEPAMELAWRTFLKFEAPDYGKEGTENFLKFISGEELYKMFLIGEYKVYVAKENDTIVGVATLRSGHHISLLFVDEAFHKKGIGKGLLSALQQDISEEYNSLIMTVNAAPYAIDFYKKLGFFETDSLKAADGICFLPMQIFTKINDD